MIDESAFAKKGSLLGMVTAVPEPGPIVLLGLSGVLGAIGYARKVAKPP